MYERFWSVYPFACGIKKGTLTKCQYYNSNKEKKIPLSDILLSYGDNVLLTDSTGLAYGKTHKGAIERGLLEVCERHLLQKSWYSNKKLILLRTRGLEQIDAKIKTFMLDGFQSIPFIVSFVIKNNNKFITGGSSMKKKLSESIEKAEQEALMIAVSIENKLVPTYKNIDLQDKYKNLSGKDVISKINHLNKKIVPKKNKLSNKTHSIEYILKKTFKQKKTLVCTIHKSPGDYVVRVIIEGAKKPRDKQGKIYPQDPFS